MAGLKDKIAKRQESNRALLQVLSQLVEANPDLRFGQILQVFGFILFKDGHNWENEFYTEPFDLIHRVRRHVIAKADTGE